MVEKKLFLRAMAAIILTGVAYAEPASYLTATGGGQPDRYKAVPDLLDAPLPGARSRADFVAMQSADAMQIKGVQIQASGTPGALHVSPQQVVGVVDPQGNGIKDLLSMKTPEKREALKAWIIQFYSNRHHIDVSKIPVFIAPIPTRGGGNFPDAMTYGGKSLREDKRMLKHLDAADVARTAALGDYGPLLIVSRSMSFNAANFTRMLLHEEYHLMFFTELTQPWRTELAGKLQKAVAATDPIKAKDIPVEKLIDKLDHLIAARQEVEAERWKTAEYNRMNDLPESGKATRYQRDNLGDYGGAWKAVTKWIPADILSQFMPTKDQLKAGTYRQPPQ